MEHWLKQIKKFCFERTTKDYDYNESVASRVQSPWSRVQSPVYRAQHPESSAQSPASRVQRPTLASRVQEFWYAR